MSDVVRDAVAAETSFVTAVTATGSLALWEEGREPLQAICEFPRLSDLIAAGYARCLFLGGQLGGDEQPPDQIATSLSRLRELLVSPAGQALDAEPFWGWWIGCGASTTVPWCAVPLRGWPPPPDGWTSTRSPKTSQGTWTVRSRPSRPSASSAD